MQGHHHGHGHGAELTTVNRAFIIGIVLNITFVAVEALAGFRTHSLALLNALILLLVVGSIGYEAILRFNRPQLVQGNVVALVAFLGIIVNGVTAYLFLKDKDKHLNAKGAYLHLATDALVSLCVVIGGILILYTHWLWLDSVLSLAIAVVILASTWGLLMDSLRLSLDGVQNGFWAYAHNPIEYSKAVNCPVLLMYGRKDETVSEEDTRLIFSNLQSSLKELKVYPNAAHENFLTQYRREWTSDVTAFVEKTEK